MPDCLDDLAILVGSRKAATQVLNRTTLAHLASASITELQLFLPEPAARKVHAAMRLGRAVLEPRRDDRPLTNPDAAHAHIYPYLAGLETERLLLVCCDTRFRAIHTEVVAQGTVNCVMNRMTDLFVPAVRHRATAIILAHNHPSGSPDPSSGDLRMTAAVMKAADLMDIQLLDHLVVANTTFTSLRGTHWSELVSL